MLLLLPIGLWLLALWRAHPTELNVDVVGNAYITWLIMTAIGLPLTKWAIVQKLKQNGEFGTEVTVRLTDAGIEGTGRHTSGKWAWAAYPRSVRFADGILLQRSRVMRWLPDSAIEVGTPEEATTLVASKSNLRRISD
ncbi:MAG TPA: hypothetical protein VFB32_01320 [Rudaea sp.]|nr:hypothetical protein [Rudaea sp.]